MNDIFKKNVLSCKENGDELIITEKLIRIIKTLSIYFLFSNSFKCSAGVTFNPFAIFTKVPNLISCFRFSILLNIAGSISFSIANLFNVAPVNNLLFLSTQTSLEINFRARLAERGPFQGTAVTVGWFKTEILS